jgi:hypothetical protein
LESLRSSELFFNGGYDSFWDYYWIYLERLFFRINESMAITKSIIKNIIQYEFYDFVILMQKWWHDSHNTEIDESITDSMWHEDVDYMVDSLEEYRIKI